MEINAIAFRVIITMEVSSFVELAIIVVNLVLIILHVQVVMKITSDS